MVCTPKYQVYCKSCYLGSPPITTGYGKKKVTKKKKPSLFTARRRKNMGVVVSPGLLDHISHNASCYSYYKESFGVDDIASSVFIQKSQKSQDASDKLGLTNTRNGLLNSDLIPEVLDNQVMYDPSVKSMDRALIGQKLANIEDDNDSVSDDNLFSPNDYDEEEVIDSKLPPSLSVDREGNNISVNYSPSGSNSAIMKPNDGRHVSDELMVKIKLMKIMQNHSIPLVAENELYEWAIKSEHIAPPGERLHMHQLGCVKRAAETFREEFLGNNTRLLGKMDRIASYYGGAVQRQSDRDFPQTNFSESIHTAKKEGNQYTDMLYIQMLTLLSAEGCQLLLSQRTTTNLENRSRKCEEEIDRRIYALELLLGMEEFLKYAETFDQVFKQDNKGKREGNNLVKNDMYFHLSQYMRLFCPPTGWDSAPSESNHITEVKTPAKRTQQIKSTPIKQTSGGWSAGSKFFISVMDGLPYMNTLFGTTEHKRYDKYCEMKLLFCAHPSFKSGSGQLSNVWYDWANFQLNLLDGRGLQVYPCQILSVSGFELVHAGYYTVAHCFLSVDPIPSKRDEGKRDRHALVKQGELRNKLYLFDCNAIKSEVAVVRNLGRKDHCFVLQNRERWLFHLCDTMAGLEEKKWN
eukprot:jgi/Psemu1/26727/gm1.26727_g